MVLGMVGKMETNYQVGGTLGWSGIDDRHSVGVE